MPPRSNNKADRLRYREETGKTTREPWGFTTPPQSPRSPPRSPPPAPKKGPRPPPPPPPPMGGAGGGIASYKNGGLVKKTGLAKLHKGEVVIPANIVKKLMKK